MVEIDGVTIQKPFLKWAGGKTQILEEILNNFPTEMENYHDIFLGGGSVLLGVLSLIQEGIIEVKNKIYAYDLNPSLINTFNQIKNNPSEVIDELDRIQEEFSSIKKNTEGQRGKPKDITEDTFKNTRENYYYWIRDLFNNSTKDSVLSSAYFIFLNKTNFKGMYRESGNGYNIPYGKKDTKKIPALFCKEDIENISNMIQDVEFQCLDFNESLKLLGEGDYVYLDPPYAPEKKESFVGYMVDGFSLETHEELFKKIKNISQEGVGFCLSNSKVELVERYFEGYTIKEIEASRRIHNKKPETTTIEVIITN